MNTRMHDPATLAQPAVAAPGGHAPLVYGLLVSAALAAAAVRLGRIGWLAAHGMSVLTMAIVLGIAAGNTLYPLVAARAGAGVNYTKQTLLRAGVVLYGLRLTLHDIGRVGVAGVAIDALVLVSTFGLGWFLGTRLFRLDRVTSILIGAGSAICGAAAVLATEPVVRGKAEQVTVAVSTVVVFGTLAIFLYPTLYHLNTQWALLPAGTTAFGVYEGSTIHEVAQVFAAGRSVGADTADIAVITKLVRVMMLAPFLVTLSAWLARDAARRDGNARHDGVRKLTLPWFAFGFVGVVAFNSLALLPAPVIAAATAVDTFLLAMAMAALGLTTHFSAIRKAGIRPLLLGAILFGWLVGGGALINDLVARWVS
ncbi:MAG: YeiH family protein [Nevskia sp.]|nr:YeiH family protein [Nevskia sp.]